MIPKYRGRSISEENKGQWVYGNLIVDGGCAYIVNGVIECNDQYITIAEWCPVDLKTIGASTGLFDKNGVEIFEGDFLKNKDKPDTILICKKSDLQASFRACSTNGMISLALWHDESRDWTVIGNIHEHPELVEVRR